MRLPFYMVLIECILVRLQVARIPCHDSDPRPVHVEAHVGKWRRDFSFHGRMFGGTTVFVIFIEIIGQPEELDEGPSRFDLAYNLFFCLLDVGLLCDRFLLPRV